jgi:hypothetical protein
MFYSENSTLTVLYCLLIFLQKFRKWFDLVWMLYAKSRKEIREQKKKRRREIKI